MHGYVLLSSKLSLLGTSFKYVTVFAITSALISMIRFSFAFLGYLILVLVELSCVSDHALH